VISSSSGAVKRRSRKALPTVDVSVFPKDIPRVN
jgi:hypothetical protein